MKILILANSQIGLYKFRKELLQALAEKHYRVYVSVPEDELTEEIKALGCKLIKNRYMDRRGTNPVKDLRLLVYYSKLIDRVKPDIVLAYTIKPNAYGGFLCRKKKIPYIATVTGLGTSVENGGLLQFITLAMYKEGLKKAQGIFFQNKSNLDFMLNRHVVNKSNSILIPGSGVNVEENSYIQYPKSSYVIFSTFGRIMKDKGINELLEAAEEVKKDHSEVIFRLIGDFDENYEEIVKGKGLRGVVEYIPFQKDIKPYIGESAAIIHPSYHEGMSNVLQEAASCGRPVLAGSIPGCQEIFEEGKTGIGFQVKNARSLKTAIEKFLALSIEQREEMGRKGREKMEREFDRKKVVERYMKEIERING